MFQIFLSLKLTDDLGRPTKEVEMADTLNAALTKLGYKVFYCRESLQEQGSSQFKQKIDEALDQVKVLLVIAADAEHTKSRWVQYEWESFYNDYLSGFKKDAELFTLTKGVNLADLPRTLRNVQHFNYETELSDLFGYLEGCFPKKKPKVEEKAPEPEIIVPNKKFDPYSIPFTKDRFRLMPIEEITPKAIQEVLDLESEVYPESGQQQLESCLEFFKVNPYIYLFFQDTATGKIVGNIDISPISDECYEMMRSGKLLDHDITPDMILSYDFPSLYNIYFAGIMIQKEYRASPLFLTMFNTVVERFIELGQREILARRMIADAVSIEGAKFCKLFGMKKVCESDHESTLYEVSLIPPEFRIASIPTKTLFDFYAAKYEEVKDFLDPEDPK